MVLEDLIRENRRDVYVVRLLQQRVLVVHIGMGSCLLVGIGMSGVCVWILGRMWVALFQLMMWS